jgi:hypothetical protein
MSTIDHFNNANLVLTPGSWVNLDNGLYYAYGTNSTMTAPSATNPASMGAITNNRTDITEVLTLDLSIDNKWYRIYYYPIVDNKDQTNAAGMVRKVYLSVQRLY